jgi:hypothetical protein
VRDPHLPIQLVTKTEFCLALWVMVTSPCHDLCVRSGANLGQSSVRALLAGAVSAIAVEGWHETYAVGASLTALANVKGLQYVYQNFNEVDFDLKLDALSPAPVDIVLLLAIYRNVALDHRDRMLSYALHKATTAIVLEGHADSVMDSVQYYMWIFRQHGGCLPPELLPKFCVWFSGSSLGLSLIVKSCAGCPSEAVQLLGHTVADPQPSRPLFWVDVKKCALVQTPFDAAVKASRSS